MSKFDELKELAEEATPGPWEATRQTDDECCFIGYFIEGVGKTISDDGTAPDHPDALFIAAANPAAILELLAIQAQLVEALKLTLPDIETAEDIQRKANKKGSRHVTKARIVRAALAAAGAQP